MATKSKKKATESEIDLIAKIHDALTLLQLPKVKAALDLHLSTPQESQTRLAWLYDLLEPQARQRIERRIERRIRESKLPERKTFEAFDFDFQPELDRDQVLDLATLKFMEPGWNILIAGMCGTGKSHIAKALGLCACMANRSVRYTTSADMLMALNASLATDKLADTVKIYTKPELLIIDEVGLEKVEKLAASRAGLMLKVLLPRYGPKHSSTIITSNIEWENWGRYFEDELGSAAIIDRLVHKSHVITINGPSYRDYEHELASASTKAKSSPKQTA